MTFDCIVVGSHLRFDGVWQRPQHIATRLGVRAPVLFVEEPFLGSADTDRIVARGALSVLRPTRRDLAAPAIDDATLDAVRRWVAWRRALVWLYTPMMNPLAAAFAWERVVYDRMDDLASFDHAPAGLREREDLLLENARDVFAGGRSLYERCRGYGAKVRLASSGVEYEHFARARAIAPHRVIADLSAGVSAAPKRPVFGYAGVIDERIDFAAIAALAARPVEVFLVGPVTKIDGALLPRRTNVHFTGQMRYGDLPSLFAGFDAAIMPFARGSATASISPTKTPEYLAAGLPVVSTPIADVVAAYADVVRFARDPVDFAEACLTTVPRDFERVERGAALARAADWDAIVTRMVAVIEGE
jgi:glycosyltransferase involved in cell wall biosynthesis